MSLFAESVAPGRPDKSLSSGTVAGNGLSRAKRTIVSNPIPLFIGHPLPRSFGRSSASVGASVSGRSFQYSGFHGVFGLQGYTGMASPSVVIQMR